MVKLPMSNPQIIQFQLRQDGYPPPRQLLSSVHILLNCDLDIRKSFFLGCPCDQQPGRPGHETL